ncbi:esterase B1-like [Bradysia coprophila]|uniref:esterase B1-like n=1 Tax=Bradysia coprophila TaxID=38358 RepID=UPI00187D88B1|nr:esterase B1-like [Bradysia coprophila]
MSSLKVKVNQGIVCGCEEKLPNGKTFLRFSGIPYAKPPINELRFRAPQPLTKFEQPELDCTRERDACIHKSTLTGKYVGSEDCLNLNVYVPVMDGDAREKLAVMVYIHGGALKYDSNSMDLHSPEFLLMENVIVITINYRLHVLGFLSLPQMGISGNAGLKDQQLALEWIHQNISNFNGDPSRICLFGESAGAVCVQFQVLNERSRKCLSSAICQSGTVLSERYMQVQPEERIKILSKRLGCTSESWENIYETLMTAGAVDLYDNCEIRLETEPNTGFKNKWRMVIEEESNDAFITKSPLELMMGQAGQINISVMSGTNNGDGMPTAMRIISRQLFSLEHIKPLISRSIRLKFGDRSDDLLRLIHKFYFDNRQLSDENVQQLVTLLSDLQYLIDQTKSNELLTRYHPQAKQFLYEFQFVGELNMMKKQMKIQNIPLASHADDVYYLFGGTLVDRAKLAKDSREWKMRETMCKLWTNFAKYGDPTPDKDNPLSFKWLAVQGADVVGGNGINHLVINDDIGLVSNLNKDRMDFWRKHLNWSEDFVWARL